MNDDRDRDDMPPTTPPSVDSEPVPDRDPELGAAIDALLVPPRPDGFVDHLIARLDDESVPPSPSPVVSRWTTRRVVRLAAAAAAAAALITAGTLFGVSRDEQRTTLGPEPATARDVIESSLSVSGAADNLQGTVVLSELHDGAFREHARSAFVVDHNGDLAMTETVTSHDPGFAMPMPWETQRSVYDAQAGTLRSVLHFATPQPFSIYGTQQVVSDLVVELNHLGAGPPYNEGGGATNSGFPFLRLRAYMRQLLQSNNSPDMRDTTIDERPAWELTTTALTGSSGFDARVGSHVVIDVDKQTRIPVLFRWSEGELRFEARIEGLHVDAPVPGGAFDLKVPDGALVWSSDDPDHGMLVWSKFLPLPVDDPPAAYAIAGCIPAMPMYRPQGYELTQATCARDQEIVSLAFRRGFDAFFVSVQALGPGSGSISEDGKTYAIHMEDAFGDTYGSTYRYLQRHTATVVLKQGPLAGYKAHIVLDPSVLPHLYVRGGVVRATVSGDLSAADMVKVAESLTPFWDGK